MPAMTTAAQNRPALTQPDFLPMSRLEMDRLDWDELDVLLISGDAYVDHPTFGAPLLGRWLVSHGLRTGIIAQPDWRSTADFKVMSRPRLMCGVTAGALDSMVAHYTAFRKKRSDDAYTPGGRAGARPNRAGIVYTNLVRQAFPGLPVVLGGIEASLRRLSHYDFWSDSLRRSILLDAKADVVVYGMAERILLDIALRLADQGSEADLTGLPGTVFTAPDDWRPPESDRGPETVDLPSHEEIIDDPFRLMEATLTLEDQVLNRRVWASQRSGGRTVFAAPPPPPLNTAQLDALYSLPFNRTAHPAYTQPVPAETMVFSSLTSHRGCGGGCSFCSLALHQGRRIRSRSRKSILDEAVRLTGHPDWRGSISDVGGPSANMWGGTCALDPDRDCKRPSCLHPRPCRNFRVDQAAGVELLDSVTRLAGVKHVRVASGIRYDLALTDRAAMNRLVRDYVGGQLKVAPEHLSGPVLNLMRKPGPEVFEEFLGCFNRESDRAGKEQYVVPYLMSAFPGCTDDDMRRLAGWLRERGWHPRQVQCFIPTPGTVATAMYFSGRDEKGRPIHVARSDAQRLRQHGLLIPASGSGGPGTKTRTGSLPKASRSGAKSGDRPPKKGNPGRRSRSHRPKKT